ncbi:hypothetical protein DJ480_30430, partial [Pseudomonas sp. Leaf98]
AKTFWLLLCLYKSDPPSGRNPKPPLPQQRICTPTNRHRRQASSHIWTEMSQWIRPISPCATCSSTAPQPGSTHTTASVHPPSRPCRPI